jgi:NADH-quinone oxidoreductase subunit L
VGLSFLFSVIAFFELLGLHAAERSIEVVLYEWIGVGQFRAALGFQIDPLSVVMLLVVTGVGFLIHVYAIGYMHGDEGYGRFFTYLNLFTFSMLLLVLANNYLLLFVGWEAVGLCSYLLIGFWFEKHSASEAGKKAFLVNRVGDFGFALGVMLIFTTFGTVDFTEVFHHAPEVSAGILIAITLLLFMGACGKSAQIPLYVWLPDAMEGPTPVSALIHAATMVTAGIYMIARSYVLFTLAPVTLSIVAIVGGATALFAATIALVQNDLKRVLAYSTISQLGYMFMALGVGAFAAGIFHLMTHAFFKALLFLGAGSVMHALSGELDIRKMGGLARHIPKTATTFIIAAIAISGIPPLAGFWSKDEILWSAFHSGNTLVWALGAVAALMTAFYMFRLVFKTFYGKSRVDPEVAHHVHESPPVMTYPLIILAVLSIIGGFVGVPPERGAFHNFLAPVFGGHGESHALTSAGGGSSLEYIMMFVSVIIAITGIGIAYLFYLKNPALPGRFVKKLSFPYKVLLNKYFVDEFYSHTVVRPGLRLASFFRRFDQVVIDGIVNGVSQLTVFTSFLSKLFDDHFVDGFVNDVADSVGGIGSRLRKIQTGLVQNYALVIVLGVVAMLTIFLLK